MKKRIYNGIEFEVGSGNVYADLGFPDADEMFAKAQITVQLQRAIKARGWSTKQAAHALDLSSDPLAAILRGRFHEVSEATLQDYVQQLGGQPGVNVNRCAPTDELPESDQLEKK